MVKSIDIDGNRVYLELYKDKEMIDSRIIVPANQVDDEFVYSRPGTSNEIRAKFMCHRLSPPFLCVSPSIHMRVECFTEANSQ